MTFRPFRSDSAGALTKIEEFVLNSVEVIWDTLEKVTVKAFVTALGMIGLAVTTTVAIAASSKEPDQARQDNLTERSVTLPSMVDSSWTAEAEGPLRDRLTSLGCRYILIDDTQVVADCPRLGIGNPEYDQSSVFRRCPSHQLIRLGADGHLACLPAD